MNQPSCERVVLVVDDDPGIREALADLLGEEGYRVVTAMNGVEALDKLREPSQARPCVILLDLMMPFMNGIIRSSRITHGRACEGSRSLSSASTPFIAVTTR